MMWFAAFALVLYGLAGAALPVGAQESSVETATDEQGAEEKGISSLVSRVLPEASIHGYSTTSYRGQWAGDDDDQDLYEYFLIDARNLIPDHLDAEVSMRMHEDFSGSLSPLELEDDIFIDIDDARDEQWPDRLNTAWADLHGFGWGDLSLRLGRQYLYEFDGLHIDGGYIRFEPRKRLEFTAFGGRPVTYYSGTHGDGTFGVSSTYRPTRSLKVRGKYYRYSDDSQNLDDDQAEIELWARRGSWAYFHGSLGTLDSDLKDLILDAKLIQHEWDAYLIVRYYRLLSEIDDHTIAFSPFFAVLDELEPFGRGEIRANKRFGQRLDVFAGVTVRREDASGDNDGDVSNSDYERYDAGVSVYPTEKWTATVAGEYWDVDQDRRFTGVTSEIAYEPWDVLMLSVGNAYGEYRNEVYDSLQQRSFRESPDVITYFTTLRWRVRDDITFRTRLEVEDTDEDLEDDLLYRLQTSLGFRF